MDAENSQQSQASGDGEVIQDVTNAPPGLQLQQPHPQAEPQNPPRTKTYPCLYCDKTFSTSMALGGHQNGHKRLRALAKRPAETPLTISNKKSLESFSSPLDNLSRLEQSYAKLWKGYPIKMPAATPAPPPPANSVPPQAAATNTRFLGVHDFFGSFSATPSNGNGATDSDKVINVEDEDEEKASGFDLDLKL